MRYRELFEAPIDDWTVDPDFDRNEAEMIGKFKGYRQEKPHWPDPDKRALRNEPHVERIRNAFERVPYRFNFYFYQGTDPDYDGYLERGMVDLKWIRDKMGDGVADYVSRTMSPETITVIFTNNISDEGYVSIASPWMMAHRLAHVFMNGTSKTVGGRVVSWVFEEFVQQITSHAYGVRWPNRDSRNGRIFWADNMTAYMEALGHALGTMKSAREGNLVQPYEWVYETFAQYLMTGDIRLNELPAQIHEEEPLTTDPEKLRKAQDVFRRFPRLAKLAFDRMLNEARGNVWVM